MERAISVCMRVCQAPMWQEPQPPLVYLLSRFDTRECAERVTACARAQIRVLGDEGGKDVEGACDDAFLKKIEATMLTQARARPARPPARFPANALRCRLLSHTLSLRAPHSGLQCFVPVPYGCSRGKHLEEAYAGNADCK